MAEPKFLKGTLVKVNNRDIRDMVWDPKLEGYHNQMGTVIDSEYWSTYYVAGENKPTDVYHYTIKFESGVTQNDIPQVILETAESE
ncbi:MAG: hypothetical protein PHN78_08280 [Dehalococcoidales bacterium]|nr:hypothetical protein [Dehalococcoidales bacterium]